MGNSPLPQVNPLGAEDLNKINQALSRIDNGLAQAELASRAGIDVTQQVQQLKDTQQKLLQVKQTYFPNAT